MSYADELGRVGTAIDQELAGLKDDVVEWAGKVTRLQGSLDAANAVIASRDTDIGNLTADLTTMTARATAEREAKQRLQAEYDAYRAAHPAEPTGPQLVSASKLAGTLLTDKAAKVPAGYGLTLPPGVISDPDLARPANYPVYGYFLASPTSVQGSGVDVTVLELRAGSLTQGYRKIASIVEPGTNPYYLARVGGKLLQDLTLHGTEQGVPYNGLVVYEVTDAVTRRVKIITVPGTGAVPPAETFPLSAYRARGSWLVEDVTIDGQGKSSNGLSWTTADPLLDIVLRRFRVFGAPHSAAATCFNQKIRSYRAEDMVVDGSMVGWNFEQIAVNGGARVNDARDSGIVLVRPDIRNPNPLGKFNGQYSHLSIEASAAAGGVSNRVDIYDPVGVSPTNPFGVTISKDYGYPGVAKGPQAQRGKDIHLWLAGVERPDLIRWHRTQGAA